jgi:molecular chaperone DnaK (HSP70)
MLEESIEYAEQDFAERQVIEARTESEAILGATQKALSAASAASLPAEERAKIDAAVASLKASVAGNDYKLIRKRIDELNHATEHLAEIVMNSAVSNALEGRKIAEV